MGKRNEQILWHNFFSLRKIWLIFKLFKTEDNFGGLTEKDFRLKGSKLIEFIYCKIILKVIKLN